MSATPSSSSRGRRATALLLGALIGVVVAVAVAALLVTIVRRQEEARRPYLQVVELTDETTDPAVWGKNFPLQYDQYTRTVDQERTRYGGSEALPRTPDDADPRSVVAQSRLEDDPRLVTFWAGYAFSHDFREERGHAYMLSDQIYTQRQQYSPQPGTCLHCHGSMYVPYKKAGNGDLFAGFEKLNQMSYEEAVKHVEHPVACIDCHDPETMQLRVTRPGFMEGMAALKKSQGIENYDVNRDATRQEMRTFVCGQCHVEYHFKGEKKRLTYPWKNGLRADDAFAYYEEIDFADWTHEISGARVLKAQHPEFEMFNQGTHARAGVACADCHMPYLRVGASKISDHHVRSPLLNIPNACQTCHRVSETELKARAELIQARTMRARNEAIDAVVALIDDIGAAREAGKTDEQLATARALQRKAQFFVDYVEAENSMGFHAPQEAMRLLAEAMDLARQGQIAVRDPDYKPQVPERPERGWGEATTGTPRLQH